MVAWIALFGLTAFVLASLIVGTRILILAGRTRGLPELVMGGSLVLAGGFGTALAIAPRLIPGSTDETVYWLQQIASTSSQIGFAMVCFFIWRVFRPGELWAKALAALLVLSLAGALAGELLDRSVGDATVGSEAGGGVYVWLSIATRLVVYLWGAGESFRYWSVMRKRQALGLAESSLVDRFYYWGVCNTAVVGIWVCSAWQRASRTGSDFSAWLSLTIAALGFVVAWSLWRAFFPGRVVRDAGIETGGTQPAR